MCKGKGLLKKLLAVTAIAGGAAVLIAKFRKNSCKECDENMDEEEEFDEENDTSSRNYVPLSHSEEDTVPEETASNDAASKDTAPAADEIAARLEQAVAETEARYEEAAKDAEVSEDKSNTPQ